MVASASLSFAAASDGVSPIGGVEGPKFFPALEGGVPGSYGVQLYSSAVASEVPELVEGVGGALGYVYKHVLNGFQATLSEEQAEALSRDPRVKSVGQERYLRDQTSSTQPYCYSTFGTDDRTTFPDLPSSGLPIAQQDVDCFDSDPASNDCVDNWGPDHCCPNV